MLILITYDISFTDTNGAKRLRQIAAHCQDYGVRVQYSVFECDVNPEQWTRLKNKWWCPKKYAASNAPVVDIEKSDGKCLNVIEHLLGKTAGFTHRTAYPLA